ncbi:hypothetical protein [Nostoc sp. PA-18-2419]|uniref:hypothetical protein n=1 Tax=Nostoc sp. PA-18-2419 TaxID=2575443 RepID=UPI001109B8D1|nr:hypothetical protein [Nostoc sp. PA-18-2419]
MPAASPTGSGDRNRRKPPRLRPPDRKASTDSAALASLRALEAGAQTLGAPLRQTKKYLCKRSVMNRLLTFAPAKIIAQC